MTLHDIIEAWLKANDYDGLCGDDCGCVLGDLMPCCENPGRCVPGYAAIATAADCERCSADPGDRIVVPDKARRVRA